ncbi:hypothetical protein RHOSPDRAFT_26897 [Rhodotorula sp. JG-1b]|nr:hypothetical protein RHOSPDRAFT_26897 [Rhodotorula sp. JG-1b]
MAQGFRELQRYVAKLDARIRTGKLLITTFSDRQICTLPDLERAFQQEVKLDYFLLLKADLLKNEVEAKTSLERMRSERDEEGKPVLRVTYFPVSAMEVGERQQRLRSWIAALPTLKLHSKVLRLRLRRSPVSRARYWSLYVTLGFKNSIPREKLTQFITQVFEVLEVLETNCQARRKALDEIETLPAEGKRYCTLVHALAAAHRVATTVDIVCKNWTEGFKWRSTSAGSDQRGDPSTVPEEYCTELLTSAITMWPRNPAKVAFKRILQELKTRIKDQKKAVKSEPRDGYWPNFKAVEEAFKHRVDLDRQDSDMTWTSFLQPTLHYQWKTYTGIVSFLLTMLRVYKEKEKLEDEIAEYSPSYLHDKVNGWYNRPWDSEDRRERHYFYFNQELNRNYWALYATIGNFTHGDLSNEQLVRWLQTRAIKSLC